MGRRRLVFLAVVGLSACGSTDGKQSDGAAGAGAIDAAAGSGGASATGGRGGASGTGGVGGSGGTGVGGGGTGGGGRGGDGGGGASGGRGGAGGLPACSLFDISAAPDNSLQHTDGPAPAPMGGEFASGTYYLTQAMYYGGTATGLTCTLTIRGVLEVSALSSSEGTIRSTDVTGGLLSPYARGWTYQTNGTPMYQYVSTCGLSGTSSVPYTATASQILVFTQPAPDCYTNPTLVRTYTKQ